MIEAPTQKRFLPGRVPRVLSFLAMATVALSACPTRGAEQQPSVATVDSSAAVAKTDAASDCAAEARQIEASFALVEMAKDQDGAFREVFEQSRGGVASCMDSEPLWYALARSAELGFGTYPVRVDGKNLVDARSVADYARARVPRSQRLQVIAARLHADVAIARAALALEPTWAPARLALARALLEAHQTAEARALLGGPEIAGVPGSDTLRAAVLLAEGKAAEAVKAARRDLKANWDRTPEPFSMRAVRCDAEEALAFALLAQRSKKAPAELRAAAGCGSTKAGRAIANDTH